MISELEQLYAFVPVGLAVFDHDLRFLRLNDQFANCTGRSVEDHLGRRLSELAPRIAEQIEPIVRDVVETGQQRLDVGVRLDPPTPGANGRSWLLRATPLAEVPGTVAVILHDVTEQQTRDEIARSEETYRSIVEFQEEFIVRWRPDGTRTFVNDAYCRYFGAGREELVGTSFFPLIAEEDREEIREKIRRITPRNPVGIDEHRVIRPDGSTGWQAWTDRGTFDLQGRLVELQSVGRDVTERRLALEALRESEERYRTLVENAPEAITVLDVETGKFCEVNENAERLFKLERDELLRRGPDEMSPALQPDGTPSAEAVAERVRLALEGGTPIFEWTHLDAEGKPFPCEIRLVRLPSSTRKLVRGSLTDISERKLLEAELRQSHKMDAIGQLAGGIAHDFNNLLTAILGNAEVALEELGPDTPVSPQLSEIHEAGERAAALTRQLLAFSRKEIVHARVLNINAIVENLSRMLGRLIGERIDLVTDLDPRLRSIRADPGQIEQLILNLALNARDAMPQGGTLTIRTRACGTCASPSAGQAHLGSAPCVLLEIADTGIGVAPDLREKIFEPFFTTKGPGKGTGLGLATVYGVVKQNGADVWVESHKGPGATFKICWPSCEERAEDKADAPPETHRGTETILLVEDEPAVREVARKGLAGYGYNVLEATNGADAMRVSDGHDGTIDLLVTDVVMPAVDGHDLARRISTTRPQTRILFVSGYSSELSNPDASRIEGEFLAKPYTSRELASVVRQILDG